MTSSLVLDRCAARSAARLSRWSNSIRPAGPLQPARAVGHAQGDHHEERSLVSALTVTESNTMRGSCVGGVGRSVRRGWSVRCLRGQFSSQVGPATLVTLAVDRVWSWAARGRAVVRARAEAPARPRHKGSPAGDPSPAAARSAPQPSRKDRSLWNARWRLAERGTWLRAWLPSWRAPAGRLPLCQYRVRQRARGRMATMTHSMKRRPAVKVGHHVSHRATLVPRQPRPCHPAPRLRDMRHIRSRRSEAEPH